MSEQCRLGNNRARKELYEQYEMCIRDSFKCDQNLLRFGEGTDEPNQLHVTTKQGKMSSNTRFALNTWYAVALVNDGKYFDIIY